MTAHAERICRFAEQVANDDDPESALRMLTELRREVDDLARVHVRRILAAGRSFGDVARALGISRQAAHRRYRDLAPPRRRPARRLVATDDTRRVLRLAQAESVASGLRATGSRQLLLGILRCDHTDAARALESEGVTLERVRALGAQSNGRGDHADADVRRILRNAGRVALAGGRHEVCPEQLLLAALADPEGGASRVVASLGVSLASIRARLSC
jgi:ATP-dependent Clp protease ATP-binding subunit ClpA